MKGAGSKLWIYDKDNAVWVPLAGTSEGAMSIHAIVEALNDIEDVNIPVPVNGEVPTWDAGTSKWITGAPVPAAHKDTHDPQDGSDKLDTAAPVKVGEANAIGTSHSFPRADHVHEKHHAKYLDTEAVAAAKTVKLDDFTAPDDNTDLDATAVLHGLIAKLDKVKLDAIAALADVTGSNAPQAHAASHKFLGSDVLNIRALVANYLLGAWLNGWESLDGWTDLSVGGTIGLETPTVRLKTNATINQVAHIHSIGAQYFAYATAAVRYIIAMRLDFRSVFSAADAWFGWFHTKTDPTAVDDRIGFHIDTNQDIYAVEGNEGGTTSEDTGVNITGVGQKDFLILYDNGSTTFYIDGALVATITTNLVDADYMYPVFYVKTTENANKEFVVMPFMSIPGEI